MFYRVLFGTMLASGTGAVYLNGGIPFVGSANASEAYRQDVPATPGQVHTAIADADLKMITVSNFSLKNNVDVQAISEGNGWRWAVKVGGKHALDLKAEVEPLEGGAASRLIATAQHGPDFASAELSSTLSDMTIVGAHLATAIEYELNALAAPGERLSADDNEKRRSQRVMKAMHAQGFRNPTGIMKDAAKMQREVGKMHGEAQKMMETGSRGSVGWKPSSSESKGGWGKPAN